jgi:hypothetical protein
MDALFTASHTMIAAETGLYLLKSGIETKHIMSGITCSCDEFIGEER